MCESLFPCHTSVQDIGDEALMITSTPGAPNLSSGGFFATLFAPTRKVTALETKRQARSTCKLSGALCPGIVIGCALCGVFAPGTCSDTCIVAGLYCGTSGYACQFEASQNSPQPSEEQEEEEEEEEEEAVEQPEIAIDGPELTEDAEGDGRKLPLFPFHLRRYPFQFGYQI